MTAALFKRHEQLNAEDWRRLSDLVQEFEAAWRQTFGPALEDFVPAGDDSLRMRSLIELVRIDQEFRWERDQRQLLEEYLAQWPELSQTPEAMLELLLAECLTRASFDAPATQAELQTRFPELAARINLDQVAALAQAEKAQASTDQKYDSPTLIKANEPAVTSLPETEDWSVVRSSRRLGKLTGKRLGRYELRRVLGNGGMGTVYEAWDTELMRAVALKMPRPELLSDPTVLQRFMTEARSAAAIRHPNVCSTFDVGQIDGQYFLTMPLIDGVSLAAWLEQRNTTAVEAAQIIRKLASALRAVHDLGTRHRDIKASNVMIDCQGEPILMDFGLARLNDTATHVTDTGSMLGTPAYMAPEQIEEGAAAGDHRADIYSLGVLFYQMLTGRLPFVGPVTKVLVQIATQTPPSITSLCPDIDSTLADICHRAMARDPSSRYQSVADLEAALNQWLYAASKTQPLVGQASQPDPNASPTPVSPKVASQKPEPIPSHRATAPSGQPGKADLRRTAVLIAAAAFFALAAAIVIKISDRAELVITSPEPGLEVKIVQLAQPEQERTLTFGDNSVRVRAGQVEVVLTGANADEYEVVGDKITLKRFGKEVVEIKRRQMIAKSREGEAPAEPLASKSTGWHGWSADAPPPAIAPFDAEQAKQHQEAWAKYLSVPVEYTNSLGMKFRLIPPGEFLMGATQKEADDVLRLIEQDKQSTSGKSRWDDPRWESLVRSELPQHRVVLTQPFYLGQHEVTQQHYQSIAGTNPSTFRAGGSHGEAVAGLDTEMFPVSGMSWEDAAEFCIKLSVKEKLKPTYFRAAESVTILGGEGYRLPTEAEWEFACRAGTTTRYFSGDSAEDLHQVGWSANSGGRPHAVGELKSSPFGLYDIHGNVWEWCQDWWTPEYYSQVRDRPAIDPICVIRPKLDETYRVSRGADWFFSDAHPCRSSLRMNWGPRHHWFGFRTALSVDAVRQTLASGNLAGDRERDAAWWALTMGGEVTVEVDGVTKTLTSVDQLPTQDFSVVGVYVHHQMRVAAEFLEKLSNLPRLEVLRLVACPMGDSMTKPIGRLTGLLHLQLNQCQMTDVGLERLQNLSKLEYLDLNHQPGITDRGLAVVRGMPRLAVLSLYGTSVSDVGLQFLRELPVAHLFLDGTKVTNAGMKSLAGLKSLTKLYLGWCAVSDDGLVQLQNLEKLHTLSLYKTSLTDRGLEHLSAMQSLRDLHVGDTKVTADGIASLQKKLPNCKITADLLTQDSPKPAEVAKVPSTSAWDLLDAAQIPASERIPEQPKELVAVLGEHRQRHAGSVASIAIRPDTKQFVTVARDGLRFWDATTFQQTSLFHPKGSARLSAAYISQGKQLVVGSEDFGNVGQIWNLDEKGISNAPPVSLPAGSGVGYTNLMVISPNEKWLIRRTEPNSEKYHLSLIALADTKPKIMAEYPNCRFAAFSPDNRLLAILREDDKTIRVLELGDRVPVERHVLKTEPEAQDDRPSKGFQQVVFLADGRLATADNNGRTWFWNLKGDQPQILFSTKRADQFLHAAQQAPIVVTAESGVSSILRIDADQAVLKHHATWTEYGRPESNLYSFAIFPDGRTAISGHLNGAIRFWDITGEKAVEKHPIAFQPVASPCVDLAVLPGVVATRDEENHLRLWQPTANGFVEHPATKGDEPQKYLPITASRDGRLLVTRPIWDGPGCTLFQWDGQKLMPHLSVGRGGAWSAAISSDNRRLAIGYRGTVDVWDITARPPRLEKTLKATDLNGAAYQTAFAKEDTLIIATMGQTPTVWNLTQDEPLPEKLLANRNPFLFAVSPTRDLLAVDGGGTQLLSVQQFPPQPILTLKSAPSQNGALSFSSDGKQLAVTDDLSVDRSIVDVHDTETGIRKHRITLPMPLRRMLFTEDNRHLITMNGNGTIYVLRLEPAPAKPSSK